MTARKWLRMAVITAVSFIGLIAGAQAAPPAAQADAESKDQLADMAKLLPAQPSLKVYIVGHTDNQDSLESNLTLSQQRAVAVVNALSGEYRVDAKRMLGRGLASLSPVASNDRHENPDLACQESI